MEFLKSLGTWSLQDICQNISVKSKNHYFFNRSVKQWDLYKSPRGKKKNRELERRQSTESRKEKQKVRERGRDFIRTVFP